METSGENYLSALLACIRQLYDLLALTATCAQAILPRARIERILSPDFAGSNLPGRDFYSELERCEHLFWTLTGDRGIV